MKRMMFGRSLRRKIRSRAGETITEVLVSLLISVVALVMLAGMISAAARLIKTSEAKMETYYGANNALVSAPSGSASDATMTIRNSDDSINMTVAIQYYANTTVANKPVIVYTKG